MVIESIVGNTLIKNDGTEVLTSNLSTSKGGVIGLYFSAHWCPPCRGFTPELATIYNELKEAKKDFEIVFVSWDSDDKSFKEYHETMPWLAIPYDKDDAKDPLGDKYEVGGIPSLVLLEADTGEVITKDGRELVDEFGACAFPFTEERLKEVKTKARAKKEEVLKEMSDLKFLGSLSTIDEPDKELNTDEIARKCEVLAIAFVKGQSCQGSGFVLPKLLEIQGNLGKEKLGVIIVEMMEDENDSYSDKVKEQIKGLPRVPRGAQAKEVAEKLKPVLKSIDSPVVFIVDAKDPLSLKIVAEDAARDIYFRGHVAYPWSEAAIKAIEEESKRLKEEMKTKIKNLEIFTPSDSCHIVDKSGAVVELATLQSKDVVGIYFSAHWCGPCRSFTPKLIEVYNECMEKGKSFEVVFLSSDEDKAAFDSYYGEMPWCALSYEDRSLKEAMSDAFEVEGIPTLVLLKGNGEKITDDGHSAVDVGVEFFPWDEESMKRGEEEAEERQKKKIEELRLKEQQIYTEQEKLGKIVIRRNTGDLQDIEIHPQDHSVKFDSFSTVAARKAAVKKDQKAFYEVTFIKGDGVSQIGWASEKFKQTDSYSGEGVGDDEHSYGFDGQRICKWHNGDSQWGAKFEPNNDNVLGTAIDLQEGKVYFGLNGNWNEPMGVAFEGLDTGIEMFPAMTASDMKIIVNFGSNPMKHGPPDGSFSTIREIVDKNGN